MKVKLSLVGFCITNSLAIFATPASAINLTPSAYFSFDGNALDGSGNGNNGTVNRFKGTSGTDSLNYTTGVNGGFGSAFRSQGTSGVADNNYVSLGSSLNSLFTNPNGSFSVSFWTKFAPSGVNGSSFDDPAFIGNKDWNSGNNFGWAIAEGEGSGNGGLQWNYRNSGGTRKDYDGAANTLNTGTWNHVVVTFDRSAVNSNAISYINGSPVDSRSLGSPLGSLTGLSLNIMQPTFRS